MKTLNKHVKQMVVMGLLSVLLLSGCATTYRIEPELVSKFNPESKPSESQTFAYIIRGWAFAGGGSGVWVAANDKVEAVLENGTHTLVKLDAGINSINLVHHRLGYGYQQLDYLPGKTIYYSYSFGGEIKQVDRELGISMIMKTKPAEEVGLVKNNDGWGNLLLSPDLLGYSTMMNSKELNEPDSNHAVINFVMPKGLPNEVPFGIWSQNGYEGSLKGGDYFQISVKPGKHTFISKFAHYSIVEADVEAGKEYFIKLHFGLGWDKAHFKMSPLDIRDDTTINNWKTSLTFKKLDESEIKKREILPRLNWGKEFFSQVTEDLASGKLKKRKLVQDYGR